MWWVRRITVVWQLCNDHHRARYILRTHGNSCKISALSCHRQNTSGQCHSLGSQVCLFDWLIFFSALPHGIHPLRRSRPGQTQETQNRRLSVDEEQQATALWFYCWVTAQRLWWRPALFCLECVYGQLLPAERVLHPFLTRGWRDQQPLTDWTYIH